MVDKKNILSLTFQRLSHNPLIKLYPRQQLGIVIRMLLDQPLPPVVQEICERCIRISTECYLIIFTPDYHTHQSYVDVERGVQGIGYVGYIFTLSIHFVQVLVVLLKLAVVHNNYELHVARAFVGVPRAFDVQFGPVGVRGGLVVLRQRVGDVSFGSVQKYISNFCLIFITFSSK